MPPTGCPAQGCPAMALSLGSTLGIAANSSAEMSCPSNSVTFWPVTLRSAWQARQRELPSARVCLAKSVLCGEWQVVHCPCSYGLCSTSSLLFSWQVKQSSFLDETSSTVVLLPSVLTLWQVLQPICMAECTALPLVLSSWHSRQFLSWTSLGSGTGCSAATAGRPHARTSRRSNNTRLPVYFTSASNHCCARA